MKRIIIGILVIFSLAPLSAQNDTVFLMNGHMVCGEITDTSDNSIKAYDCKRPGKILEYEAEEIFSFKKKDQQERFFYYEQPDNPNWFSRRDFKFYMQAERDARSNYRSKGAFLGGIGGGILGGNSGNFFGLLAPVATLGVTQLFKIRIRKKAVSRIEYLDETAYVQGYNRQARSKRSFQSLTGSLIGLGVGYGVYFLTGYSYLDFLRNKK
jgi:hypothetical protein